MRLTPNDLFRFAAKHPRLPKDEKERVKNRRPLVPVIKGSTVKWKKSRHQWLPPIYIRVGKYHGKGVKTELVYDGADAKRHGSKVACSHIALDYDSKTGELVGIEII